MTQHRDSVFSLRQWAPALAIAVLTPAAVLALTLTALWSLGAWGDDIRIPEGTAAEPSTVAFLVLLAVLATMACWWVWLCLAHRVPVREGLLATIPGLGVIWGLKVSSGIARGEYRRLPVERQHMAVLIAIPTVTALLVPFAMSLANGAQLAEEARLTSSCLDVTLPVTDEDEIVAEAGGQRISARLLEELAASAAENQPGVLYRRVDRWQVPVLEAVISASLVRDEAIRQKVPATVGDAERRTVDVEVGTASGPLASTSPEVEMFLACADVARSGVDPANLPGARGVTIVDGFGFWNATELRIDAMPQQSVPVTTGNAAPMDLTFDSRVEYEGVSIPTKEFPGSLDWQADLCVGVPELLQSSVAARVGLFERVEGSWRPVSGKKVTAKRGGRCGSAQINLLVGGRAQEPAPNWIDKDWQTCRAYQVRIPETRTFRATSVDLCVSTRASSKGGAS